MNDRFQLILASLPKKRQRSKLDPYAGLIEQLRRRGHPYREIAKILMEKCDLVLASSTIVRFVAARSKEKRQRRKNHETRKTSHGVPANIQVNKGPTVSSEDLRKRIEMLKQQPAKAEQPSKRFEYDPDQPLKLPYKK
jgi:hypothetical protein